MAVTFEGDTSISGQITLGVTILNRLGDLNVPAERIPTFYSADGAISTYQAAQSWNEYDVTCTADPCASGKASYKDQAAMSSCSAVTTSNVTGLQCMIDAADSNTVLFIPDGHYLVDGTLFLDRSNIVVRGESRTGTELARNSTTHESYGGDCDANSAALVFSVCQDGYDGAWTPWIAGYARGDTTVTVSNPSAFSVGGWVRLLMSGTTACEYMDRTLSGGTDSDGFNHIAKITAKSGNDITIDRGLRMDYVGTGCTGYEAHVYAPPTNIGIENLRLTTDPSVEVCFANNGVTGSGCTCPSGGDCIKKYPLVNFYGAANSWLVNSNIDRAYDRWVVVKYSARNWIQGNDFSDLDTSIYDNTQAVYLSFGAVDNVVENNTCTSSNLCTKIENGAEGNVYAYNYSRNASAEADRTTSLHGHYTREILEEGNDVDTMLSIGDNFWGRNGPRITAYRNRNSQTDCGAGYYSASATDGSIAYNNAFDAIGPKGNNLTYPVGSDANLIGNTANQLSAAPVHTTPLCPPSYTSYTFAQFISGLWMEDNVWRYASGDSFNYGSGNNRSCGTAENDTCPGTNVNQQGPDASWASKTFPASLYRTSEPSWWCQEACSWSNPHNGIGAFGDDFSGTLCKLPAQIRYEAGTCTPP